MVAQPSSEFEPWDPDGEKDHAPVRPGCSPRYCWPAQDGSIHHLVTCSNAPPSHYRMYPWKMKRGEERPKIPPFTPGGDGLRLAVGRALDFAHSMDKLTPARQTVLVYMLEKMYKAGVSEIGMGSDDAVALGMSRQQMYVHLKALTSNERWGFYLQPVVQAVATPRMRFNAEANTRHRRQMWFRLRDPRGKDLEEWPGGVEQP